MSACFLIQYCVEKEVSRHYALLSMKQLAQTVWEPFDKLVIRNIKEAHSDFIERLFHALFDIRVGCCGLRRCNDASFSACLLRVVAKLPLCLMNFD